MKAIVWTNYGPPDVLQLQEVEKPRPRDNEVLVKVAATTVTAGDCEARRLQFPLFLGVPMRFYVGLTKPKRITILGQELAGEIESVGNDVKLFKEGDPIFAATGFSMGAYAEYICLPEESDGGVLAIKPANISFEEAAAVPVGGLEALHFLRKAAVRRGQSLLINGAGGSIGTMGIQLAKQFGAEVTAVDSSEKLEMLRSIGADHVIDYTKEDFSKNGNSYDIIFDVVGKAPFPGSLQSLKEGGTYISANPGLSQMLRGPWYSRRSGKKVLFGTASRKPQDLVALRELIEAGKIRPVIDRQYPLQETAEAHRYVESGQKKGNVVISVAHRDET